MSHFDDIAKVAARDILTHIGEEVVYVGAGDDIRTVAAIQKNLGILGFEGPVGESRWTCSLSVEDVGSPHRGDTVSTATGAEWILGEEITTSGRWITKWTVTRR